MNSSTRAGPAHWNPSARRSPRWASSCGLNSPRVTDTCPLVQNVLRAFTFPFERVRVLIVGQDPYPTPGHAVGLSFSVAADVRPLPRSLENIFTEYGKDLGSPRTSQRRPDARGPSAG